MGHGPHRHRKWMHQYIGPDHCHTLLLLWQSLHTAPIRQKCNYPGSQGFSNVFCCENNFKQAMFLMKCVGDMGYMVYPDDAISSEIQLTDGRSCLIMWYGIIPRYQCIDHVCGIMYTMWKAGYIGQSSNLVRGLDDRRCCLTGLH